MGVHVSVIVPVYNDPEGIATTLRALTKQKYPTTSYEIIVCDNGSTDATQAVVRRFQEKCGEVIRLVIEDKQQSSYAARNKGIAAAQGEILAFVDADMWMDEDWLTKVVDTMQDESIHYLGCNVEIVTAGISLVGRYNATFGFPVEKYLRENHYAPTCCLVARRKLFGSLGPFDATLRSGGDVLFGRVAHDSGMQQHFARGIRLYHPARDTLRSFASKHFRIGRGHRQLSRRRPDIYMGESSAASWFLPVKPAAYLEMVKTKDGSAQLHWEEHLAFYLLTCIRKWARNVGYAYQGLVERCGSRAATRERPQGAR